MTDYESWYQQQVESGKLPDKDGYYHYPQQKEYKTWYDAWYEMYNIIKEDEE